VRGGVVGLLTLHASSLLALKHPSSGSGFPSFYSGGHDLTVALL
jgi:hypothetical protein